MNSIFYIHTYIYIYICVCVCVCVCVWCFPGGSEVKNLPAVQEPREMHIWSLGQEDPLEEVMATPSSILAWRMPWTEEPGGLQSIASQRVGHDWSDLACIHVYVCVSKACYLVWRTSLNPTVSSRLPLSPLLQADCAKLLFVTPLTIAARLLCPWHSPGKNTGGSCHDLLQWIFLTQGLNPSLLCLLLWWVGSLPLAPPGLSRPVSSSFLGISYFRDSWQGKHRLLTKEILVATREFLRWMLYNKPHTGET